MYNHILIATDGSELADKGLEHGLTLASRLGAQVTVLTATKPLPAEAVSSAMAAGVDDPVGRYDQQIAAALKERFKTVDEKARAHGVSVQFVHEIDDFPAEAIVRSAKLRGCDLIVMASHGRRGAKRLLLGSQTAEVVTHTEIPVLVVR